MFTSIIFVAFTIICSVSCSINIRNAVDFQLCTDEIQTGILSNVIVAGCTTLPCTFTRGQNYSIEIDFENNRPTEILYAEVFGIVQGIKVPWPGLDHNGCDHMLVGWCPMGTGDYVTYGMAMGVDTFYPAVEAKLRWSLTGDDKRHIFCFEIPVRLA